LRRADADHVEAKLASPALLVEIMVQAAKELSPTAR